MASLLSVIAGLIYRYGVSCAGIPGTHGSYEAPVPTQLHEATGE